jgi:hypothetical protein
MPDHVARRVSEDAREAVVHENEHAVAIGQGIPFVHHFDEKAESLLAVSQCCFAPLALPDVAHDDRDTFDVAVRRSARNQDL